MPGTVQPRRPHEAWSVDLRAGRVRLSGGKYLLTALYHRCHQNKNNFPGLELAKTQASRQKPIIQRETSTATHDALCFGRGAVLGGARHPPSPPCEGAGRRGVCAALSRLLPRGQWRSEEPAGPLAAPAELAGLGALGALPDGACLLRRGCFGVAGACVCVCAPCSHFLVVSCEPGAPCRTLPPTGSHSKPQTRLSLRILREPRSGPASGSQLLFRG